MRFLSMIASVGVLGFAMVAVAGDPSPEELAAMKKCSVCKELANKPELMRNMTWETHKIANGMLCVASVPKDEAKQFAAVHQQMMDKVKQVKAERKAGQKVELCSFCDGVGELENAGAKQEEIVTETGAITLLTSNDPQVVQKIHHQADEAIAQQKKMQHSSSAGGR